MKFDGVERNPQPTRNCFVGGTVRHRREHFKFAGRQLRIPVIAMGKAAGYRRRELERQGSLTRSALACQSLRSNDIE